MINNKREGNNYNQELKKTHENHDQDVKGDNVIKNTKKGNKDDHYKSTKEDDNNDQ